MAEAETIDPGVQSSHEVDGRILTGVGVSPEALAETMERRSDADGIEAPSADASAAPVPVKADQPVQTRGQKRFAELTREREDARREAAEAKKEAADLRAKYAAQPAPAAQPEPVKAEAKPAAQTRQKPTENEIGEKYQSYADFAEDLADWKVEQRLSALNLDATIRQSIEADRASRSRADLVTQVVTRGRSAYADFDAVLSAPHMATDWPVDKLNAIASLDAPEHIQYALGKDPSLAERLRTATPVQFGMDLAKLIAPQAVASPASTAAVPLNVPAPYQPVGSGSKTASIPSADLTRKGFDYDRSGYREKRAAERGTRR